ncbi:hypothetical protein AVEN_16696-1 [Araneus ventricosus]|uniref:Uncharacterized protein n=1 Tax=Araneus ventricosus TaxID=182803 RepID=A0A4Y2BTC7_ARAVE|nr:hypothetical protein AVEN_16696-1 [Araneus ventricosus]
MLSLKECNKVFPILQTIGLFSTIASAGESDLGPSCLGNSFLTVELQSAKGDSHRFLFWFMVSSYLPYRIGLEIKLCNCVGQCSRTDQLFGLILIVEPANRTYFKNDEASHTYFFSFNVTILRKERDGIFCSCLCGSG